MPAIMIDSDQPDILFDARFNGLRLATYADLATPELVARGGWRLSWIDRGLGDPLGIATIADIEPRALTVEEGAQRVRQWVAEKRLWPTAYHDRSLWPAVNQALAGVPYSHWVATLDGTCMPDGEMPTAVQILTAAAVGVPVDMSIVWVDAWKPVPYTLPLSALAGVKDRIAAMSGSMENLQTYVLSLLGALRATGVLVPGMRQPG